MTGKASVGKWALLAVAAGLAWAAVIFWPKPRQNVLLITLDTTRADRIGCYGHAAAKTPALDGLAERGVLFERAYAAVPLTLPSHATLMTGRYPPEHGIRYNGQNRLGSEFPTLAEVLQQAGYQTGAFVGALVLKKKFGLARGFDIYDDDMRGGEPGHDQLDRMRRGELVVDAALDWLSQQTTSKPFFCWVHFYDPHHPYLAHEAEFGDEFQSRPYDGEIAYVDRQIARLLQALQEKGMDRRTLIVVAGDHGESLGEHGEATHAYMLYESTMRVPLIIADPRREKVGHRAKEVVSLADVGPTMLELLDSRFPKPVSGRSLAPALAGRPLEPRPLYGETEQPFGEFHFAPLRSLTTERWKYVRTARRELYDLAADPAELHDLSALQPDQMLELDQQLMELESRLTKGHAPAAELSSQEERALSSLGYAGGNAADVAADLEGLTDIKDMIAVVSRYNEALHLMAENRYSAAEAMLREIASAAPELFLAHHNLAVCLNSQGRADAAFASFQRALEIKNDPQTRMETAKLLIDLSRPAEAIPHLEAAREFWPESPQPPFYLGEVLQLIGKPDEAREQYRLAVKLDSSYLPARKALLQLQDRGL